MAKPLLVLKLQGAGARDEDIIVIDRTPFVIGRDRRLDACIPQREISAKHAQIDFVQDTWLITDQGSTNGTFLNGKKLEPDEPQAIHEGDFLSLSKRLYLVMPQKNTPSDSFGTVTIDFPATDVIREALELIHILGERRALPHFQSIVDLPSRQPVGWEALGRARTPAGPFPIGKLFQLSTQQGREIDLSQLFRDATRHCLECRFCWRNQQPMLLFFNLHPAEIRDEDRLFHSLRTLSESAPIRQWYRPVVEMPESWASTVQQMSRIVERIRALNLLVAYDDFGQGQSRLEDLVRTPPDFVKLDRRLVEDLGGPRAMSKIVQAVVDTCHEHGVKTIAEGIETEGEYQACLQMKMDLGQGYLFETPQPAFDLFQAMPQDLIEQRPTCPYVRLGVISSD